MTTDERAGAAKVARAVALPSPTQAQQWEKACPGSFNRIMTEIEVEEKHRRRIELAETALRLFGQLCGFGTVVVFAILAKYFVDHQAPTQGASIMISGAVSIVAVFVTGKLLRRN